MLDDALRFGMIRAERRRQYKGDVALPQHIPGLILLPGFQAGVGDDLEAEGVAVEVRRLPGVADEEA